MRLKLLFFISFISLFSFAQNDTFYRKYNLSGMQGGLGLVNLTDGGFVGTGQHEANGSAGGCDIFVYRVDACGTLLWMKLIGTSAIEGGKSISLKSNGNLLIVGLYDLKGMIIEMDLNGNLIWEKRYDNTAFTMSIAECNNGDLIVTSMTSANQFSLFRCNSIGNVIWSKVISDLGEYPSSVIALSNGNILVNSTFNINGMDFAAMLLDASGNLLWSKCYGGVGYLETDYQSWGSKAIYDVRDNSVVLISETYQRGNDDIIFAKLNIVDGSILWSKLIGDSGSEQARDIVKTVDGYAIVGNSNSYPVAASSNPTVLTEDMSERDVLLCNLDFTGSIIWARTYGGNERDKGIGLRYNVDSTFLISAYTSSPVFGNFDPSMDPLFIKTDSIGIVGCQYNTPPVSVQNIVLTSPVRGTIAPGLVSEIISNSIISSFVPPDSYQCLQCRTQPVFKASDTIVCVNDPIYFYNTTSVGLTCFQKWSVDGHLYDGSIDTINYTFTSPGDYTILLYSDCGASTDTFRVNIKVNPFPVADFNTVNNCILDTSGILDHSTITSGSIQTWDWNLGDGSFSNLQNPVHVYQAPGTYQIDLIVTSAFGCADTTSGNIIIYPLPEPTFTFNNICLVDTAHFLCNNNFQYPVNTYQWSFGDGSFSNSVNASHIYNNAGNYFVQVKVIDINGCNGKYISSIDVFSMPEAKFSYPPLECDLFPTVNFKNESYNSTKWMWYFGDDNTSDEYSPSHKFYSRGIFEIILYATTDNGCVDSASASMEVKDGFSFWIPNAFTPNDDNMNEKFAPKTEGVSEFKMEIFNRWGRLIYSTKNLTDGWDSNTGSRPAQEDVYVYKIAIMDFCGDKHDYIGHFTLLR